MIARIDDADKALSPQSVTIDELDGTEVEARVARVHYSQPRGAASLRAASTRR